MFSQTRAILRAAATRILCRLPGAHGQKAGVRPGDCSLNVVLGALALWLLTHPYTGFDHHDTRIYSVLALHWLNPDAYARDPFFMFGSQDSLSLFSPLYGTLIKFFGLGAASKIVLLSGAIVWLAAAILLARQLLSHPLARIVAVLAMMVLMQNYSPNGETFVLNEYFATARSWAFALGALALGLWLSERPGAAWGLAVSTLLIHPLIGIFVIAVGLLWRLPDRIGFVLVLMASILLAGLAMSQRGPFVWFDPVWLEFIREHARDVLVGKQGRARYDAVLFYLSLCFLAARVSSDTRIRRFYLWAGLVSAGGFAAATLASHVAPSQLLVQAQLWRSVWLVALLSPFAAAQVFFSLWYRGNQALPLPALTWFRRSNTWLALGGVALLFMLPEHQGMLLAIVCLLRWLASDHLARALDWLQVHVRFVRMAVLGLLLLGLPVYWVEQQILMGSIGIPAWPEAPVWLGVLVRGGYGPGFVVVAALLLYGQRKVCLFAALLLFLFALATWDTRTEKDLAWGRHIANGERGGPLGALIKPGEVVLWSRRMPVRVWYDLGTAHYASPTQAVGFVFSRAKAEELLRRTALIRSAYAMETGREADAAVMSEQSENPDAIFGFSVPHSATAIRQLCQDVALDWVVVEAGQAYDAAVPTVYDAIGKASLAAHPCAYYRVRSAGHGL